MKARDGGQINSTTRILYRQLLREITYLAHRPARLYLQSYIRQTFKTTTPATPSRLRKARSGLNVLRRANDGDASNLLRTLQMTYGRVGRRKRLLLQEIRQADPDSIAQLTRATAEPVEDASISSVIKPAVLSNGSNPRFEALLKAHVDRQQLIGNRAPIRTTKPVLPETNAWGRSLPLKLKAGLERRFWKATLSKILPPLPAKEWNDIRDLATGVSPIDIPKTRRTPIRSTDDEQGQSLWQKQYLMMPVYAGARYGKAPVDVERRKITYTNRSMRRLWTKLWGTCPVMVKDESSNAWKVKWGRSTVSLSSAVKATPRDIEFFTDYDFTGKNEAKRGSGR